MSTSQASPVPRIRRRAGWTRRDSLLLIGAAVMVGVPLLYVARLATRTVESFQASPSTIDGGFTLSNFATALASGGLGDALRSSVAVVAVGVPLATALAAMSGFALAKLEVPFRPLVLAAVVACLMVPPVALAVPTFDLALQFDLVDSKLAVGLIYGVLFSGWGTLFMRAFFSGFPDELLESAILDGASITRAFVSIALPLALPALGTVLLINVLIQWSELILALLLLTSPSNQTVSVVIANYGSSQLLDGGPIVAAAMLIVSLPIIALFLVSQRWLRTDILAGAVKG